ASADGYRVRGRPPDLHVDLVPDVVRAGAAGQLPDQPTIQNAWRTAGCYRGCSRGSQRMAVRVEDDPVRHRIPRDVGETAAWAPKLQPIRAHTSFVTATSYDASVPIGTTCWQGSSATLHNDWLMLLCQRAYPAYYNDDATAGLPPIRRPFCADA